MNTETWKQRVRAGRKQHSGNPGHRVLLYVLEKPEEDAVAVQVIVVERGENLSVPRSMIPSDLWAVLDEDVLLFATRRHYKDDPDRVLFEAMELAGHHARTDRNLVPGP